jgi:hypothetical protein
MSTNDYDIHLDDKFGHLNHIDIGAEAARHEPWFNQTPRANSRSRSRAVTRCA